MKTIISLLLLTISLVGFSQIDKARQTIKARANEVEKKVIAWRRDIHEHPELGNREFRTAEIIAKHLQSLGIEVKTGVAKTGVVGLLKGGLPGPVVALRADMDALPVYEKNDLPFASKSTTTYNGQQVGVMHACGHDTHVAMLMGVAEVLASMRKELKGSVKFIFQPAEEGAQNDEEFGAQLMVKEGVLENPKVDVIFGLHISATNEVGTITYRPGGEMAAADGLRIIVSGKPSHGAQPWLSVDPILVSAQIINSLQSIVSRNVNLTENPAVITIGSIHGGNRGNIISEKVEMIGTVRTLSSSDEKMVIKRINEVATLTAQAAGATAQVDLPFEFHYPVTFNDIALTNQMLPSIQKSAGPENVKLVPPITGSEDFSFYSEKVPGLFLFVGGMPKGADPRNAGPHHTPQFFIDESGLLLGVTTLCNLVVDYAKGK